MLPLLAACSPSPVVAEKPADTALPDERADTALLEDTADSAPPADTADSAADTGEGDPPPRDQDHDGSALPDDCDDADAAIHPGATEVCDATDNDCNGKVDDDELVMGDSPLCPAPDCLTIFSNRVGVPDGVYWIEVDGLSHDVVCDMTTDHGGWTLVANFVWPGHTSGVPGWTSGAAVGTTTSDRTQSFKLSDSEINTLVTWRYRARGTATTCTQADYSVSACTVDTTLYWDFACTYDSGAPSSGACTAAYQTVDLQDWTQLSSPCGWHYGLTSANCGVTSEFGTSHEGEHVFAGHVGTYIHAYDGRDLEDPSVEVWVR